MEDQIHGAQELLDQFSFLDPEKVGIWGWSYGGYATAMTLIKDEKNLFKCGLSTAPPTNWLLYDSMYTERYMGLPTLEDNLSGTEYSGVVQRGSRGLLIAPECSTVLQSALECSRVLQSAPKCSRVL